ncbi:MAG: hypothetical protein IJG84_19860 [Kiritimatiellae bacterium]|nr:hypothetical protein [Kiritimatiellia bacterium]
MLKYQNYLLDFPERDKLNRIIDYFITSSEPDLIVPIFEEWLESRFKEYRKHVFYVDLAICKSTQTKSYIFLCENARFKEQYSSFIDEEIKANRGIAVKKEFVDGSFGNTLPNDMPYAFYLTYHSGEKSEVPDFIRGYVEWVEKAKMGVKEIKIVPVNIPGQFGTMTNLAQIFVGFKDVWCDSDKFIKEITFLIYYAKMRSYYLDIMMSNVKSAIGSIMSRNGSHNIGSHVLSALSHNVGTMPDDRVLYQYIQHRMDYIATATTEFPQWTTPTMFVGGLMKNFYAQKHLLDYISRSEGLRAYKFQERNLDDATRMNQHGTIRLFLRRFYKLDETNQGELPREHRYLTYDQHGRAWSIYYFFGEKDKMFRQKFSEDKRTQYEASESGGTAKFLEYDERFTPDWRQDVRLAIPGGIVGQHAFYTIIENVIRNAAKHGWASEKNLAEKDLEVYIDFGEKKATGSVVFTIGDNVSDIFGAARQFWDDFFETFSSVDLLRALLRTSQEVINQIRTVVNTAKDNSLDGNGARMIDVYGRILEVVSWSDSEALQSVTNPTFKQKQVVDYLDNWLPIAFTSQLTESDAGQLERYLRKEYGGRNNGINCLPVQYSLQKIFLEKTTGSIEEWELSLDRQNFIRQAAKNGDGIRRLALLPSHLIQLEMGCQVEEWNLSGFWRDFRAALCFGKFWTKNGRDQFYPELAKCKKESRQGKYSYNGLWERFLDLCAEDKLAEMDHDIKAMLEGDLSQVELDMLKRWLDGKSLDDSLPFIYRVQRLYLSISMPAWKKRYENFLTENVPDASVWELGHRLILPLHHNQHRKLAQSFIDSDGKLRKENWGLAEMKISAGYLAQRETSEIGGLGVKGNSIIVPVAMPGLCRNADNPRNCLMCSDRTRLAGYSSDPNCPLNKHSYHLGYRNEIAKPKDILILFEDVDESVVAAIQNKSYEGIDFARRSKPSDGDKWCSYRLISSDRVDDEIERFNYRYVVLVGQPKMVVAKDASVMALRQRLGFRYIIWDDKDKEVLINLIKGGDPAELRKAVFSAWIRHLANDCRGLVKCPVKLVVNVDGNEGGRERGLVTRKDLLRTMFVECYHTALTSFLKNPPEPLELSDTSRNLITLLSLIKVLPEAMVEPQQDYGHGDDKGAKEYIRAQLMKYCDLLKSHLMLSREFIDALKSIEKYVEDEAGTGDAVIVRKIEDISKDFEKAIARRLFRGKQDEDDDIKRWCRDLIVFLQKVDKVKLDGWLDAFHGGSGRFNCPQREDSYGYGRHSFEDNLKAIITACSVPEEDEFNALVESLNSMFLASDVYLRKYEERIVTLPEAYKHDGTNRETKGNGSFKGESVQAIADTLMGTTLADDSNRKVIKYSRHDHAMPANGIYSEALSGSQSYLNALSRLVYASGEDKNGERYAQVARLLENAFLRILIIDERVMNFVEERRSDEMKKTLINMGIWVADIVNEGVAKASAEVRDELYQFHHHKDVAKSMDDSRSYYIDIDPCQFDILVIHQGVIDKWWERHDEAKVKEILEDLRHSIPRVVVTTGRGRPENIPADEKVLPFSVIESSLFKRYPEKLIFVNTIMNLLPYGSDKIKSS